MKHSSAILVPILVLLATGCRMPASDAPRASARARVANVPLAPNEEAFLEDLQHRIFDFFWEEVYPETGIVVDHTENRTGKVAATGFGLAAICIGVERGWITYTQGYERVSLIMNSFWDDPDDPDDSCVEGKYGLFWHFVDGRTGKMKPLDCVALCDSADFIAGVIVAGEYFKGTPLEELAGKICDRVEWEQFVSKHADGTPGLLSFGWVPLHVSESYYEVDGLLPFNMSGLVDNSLLIYVLALGSDTHPIPQATWEEYVDSYTLTEYGGYECVFAGALFVRQVPQAFIPFSRKRDRKVDYFEDAVNAILADRIFNMRVNDYPPQVWGLNDCFGKDSYSHAAPPGGVMNDGTVAGCSFSGALPHVPRLSLDAMAYVRERYGDRAYGKYGFTSSINPKTDFVSPLFVGIELGPEIMLIENARSGLIWELFGRSRVMRNFVERARISGVVDDFELAPEAPAYATWSVSSGELAVGTDSPQKGKKCLSIRTDSKVATLYGALPVNDLLNYDYARHLSFWIRDADVVACRARISGTLRDLAPSGMLEGREWRHFYYKLPDTTEEDALEEIVLTLKGEGRRMAVDNVSVVRQAVLKRPGQIDEFSAGGGKSGGAVALGWRVPEDDASARIVGYVLSMESPDGSEEPRFMSLKAGAGPGEEDRRMVVVGSGKKYRLSLAAVDEHGHVGAFSDGVEARGHTNVASGMAYDFRDGSAAGWEADAPSTLFSVVDDESHGKCLRVDFQKTHGWNHLSVRVDPDMIAMCRYVNLKVKGNLQMLGKLWCSDALQQDMEVLQTDPMSEWTEMKFDTLRAGRINPNRDRVQKILFFPQPGESSGGGTFYVDELRYSND